MKNNRTTQNPLNDLCEYFRDEKKSKIKLYYALSEKLGSQAAYVYGIINHHVENQVREETIDIDNPVEMILNKSYFIEHYLITRTKLENGLELLEKNGFISIKGRSVVVDQIKLKKLELWQV